MESMCGLSLSTHGFEMFAVDSATVTSAKLWCSATVMTPVTVNAL